MSWSDNFPVYLDNLSAVYTASVLIAVFSLFVAHYYQHHENEESQNDKSKKGNSIDKNEEDRPENDGVESPYVKGEFGGAFGRIKAAKQDALLKSIQTEDTEEQKIIEKRAEEEQLTAIWTLLKQQEEKFNMSSKEELEDQLRLYRR